MLDLALLAITQDILRIGRRAYLEAAVGEVVSFDEVYHNLAGEGELSPDVRRQLGRIGEVVPGANALTGRWAEVLYLIREIAFVPRTIDNLLRGTGSRQRTWVAAPGRADRRGRAPR